MDKQKAIAITTEIFELYTRYGSSDYIGEPVSQLEHMCQAAQMAAAEGADDEMLLAAFFHDIGHLCEFIMPLEKMEGIGIVDHESIGEEYLLSRGFSPRLGRLVQGHVPAKRYLTFKYPEYYQRLSQASKETLTIQGGVMQADEAAAFEADPLFADYIKMREWDDRAKLVNTPIPDLDFLKEMAIQHLMNQN
jgi:phosphonate degradation associated HDIG domain protein